MHRVHRSVFLVARTPGDRAVRGPRVARVMDAAIIRANADRVRNRISDAGGDPDAIRLVAVTKGHPAAVVRGALDAGLADIGENYAQELGAKAAAVNAAANGEVRW